MAVTFNDERGQSLIPKHGRYVARASLKSLIKKGVAVSANRVHASSLSVGKNPHIFFKSLTKSNCFCLFSTIFSL